LSILTRAGGSEGEDRAQRSLVEEILECLIEVSRRMREVDENAFADKAFGVAFQTHGLMT